MHTFKVLLCLALFGLGVSLSSAQNLGSSPYSRLGIGDQVDPAFSRNTGLGSAGVALTHPLQLNFINPASLASIKYTNFEFGVVGKIQKNYTSDDYARGGTGNIHHVSLALPIHKKYKAQIGLRPYSVVNYKDEYQAAGIAENKLFNIALSGSGGLSEFFLGNAYSYKDWLMVGCQVGYIVGQSTIQRSITDVGNKQSVFQNQKSESHLRIAPGILLTKKIKKRVVDNSPMDSLVKDTSTKVSNVIKKQLETVNEDWAIGFGLTGSFYHMMQIRQTNYFKSLNYSSGGYTLYAIDTLSFPIVSYSLPSSVRVGLSLYKLNHITYALDYYYSNWSSLKDNLGVVYRQQHSMALGAEFIPDYNSIYLYNRIAYRIGLKASTLPYEVVDQSISEWQANVGAGIILPKSGVSLNVSLSYGQRGTTSANLIKENYWLLTVGVISNSKWFVRPKHD